MTILEKENFNDLIKEGVVLVDFYADWCGPCKMMGAVLEEVDNEINIVKVNVDNFDELARTYGVMSIPTLLVFKDGELKEKNVGFMDKDSLLKMVNSVK